MSRCLNKKYNELIHQLYVEFYTIAESAIEPYVGKLTWDELKTYAVESKDKYDQRRFVPFDSFYIPDNEFRIITHRYLNKFRNKYYKDCFSFEANLGPSPTCSKENFDNIKTNLKKVYNYHHGSFTSLGTNIEEIEPAVLTILGTTHTKQISDIAIAIAFINNVNLHKNESKKDLSMDT